MRGQAKTLEELLRLWSAKGRHILVLIQLRLRSTQLLLVRPAYGHFLRAFECMFVWIFGCHHRHLSRVFTIDRQTYQGVLRLRCQTAIFVENDVTCQDGECR